MNSDQQVALLTEIKDILRDQTELVRGQWIEHAKLSRQNLVASIVMAFPLAVLVAYLIVKDF